MLVFVFGLIGASMFYPDFSKTLTEAFKSSMMIWVFIGLFVGVLFFTSGLYEVLIYGPMSADGGAGIKSDVQAMIIMMAALIIGILILVGVQRGTGGK